MKKKSHLLLQAPIQLLHPYTHSHEHLYISLSLRFTTIYRSATPDHKKEEKREEGFHVSLHDGLRHRGPPLTFFNIIFALAAPSLFFLLKRHAFCLDSYRDYFLRRLSPISFAPSPLLIPFSCRNTADIFGQIG